MLLDLSAPGYAKTRLSDRLPIEQLRGRTAVVVIDREVHLSGTVTDAAGKPIGAAHVAIGPLYRDSNPTVTASDGKFA